MNFAEILLDVARTRSKVFAATTSVQDLCQRQTDASIELADAEAAYNQAFSNLVTAMQDGEAFDKFVARVMQSR